MMIVVMIVATALVSIVVVFPAAGVVSWAVGVDVFLGPSGLGVHPDGC